MKIDTEIENSLHTELNTKQVNNSIASLRQTITKAVKPMIDDTMVASVRETISTFASMAQEMVASVVQAATSVYTQSIKEAFADIGKIIAEARENPNSYFNFHEYQKKLDIFHWAWPYGITAEELKVLLEEANDEKEFDKLLVAFFSKERMNNMLNDICILLPRKHKGIFKQIKEAYKNRYYALINNAIISIIDNLLSDMLKNKGCVARKGILEPIVDFYGNNYALYEVDFIFELQMLSNNLNLIFADYNFDDKIVLDTNKKVRRHLAAHGFSYSNKRTDSIMLLNTLMALLDNWIYLEPFKNTLGRDKGTKKFFITSSDKVLFNRIYKKLEIEFI